MIIFYKVDFGWYLLYIKNDILKNIKFKVVWLIIFVLVLVRFEECK